MTTPIVTQGTIITCPHAIPATITASGSKLLIAGTPAALMGDKGTVSGCPFTTPEPKPQPCVIAELTKAAGKVTSGGTPVLLVNARAKKRASWLNMGLHLATRRGGAGFNHRECPRILSGVMR